MPSSRTTSPVYPAQLTTWFRSRVRLAAAAGTPILGSWWIRTSGRGIDKWEESREITFAGIDRTTEDVARAIDLGFDIVRRDAIGEERRRELGSDIFVLKMGHAPGGKGNRELGVILHVGQTLFFYVLDTARGNNLKVGREDEWGNALTEILRTTIREVSDAGVAFGDLNYRFELKARELGRVVRNENHASSLRRTMTHHKIWLTVGATRYDFSDATSSSQFSFGAMMEQAQVESIIRGLHRPEVVIQASGGWYEDIKLIPFTHGASRTIETTRSGIEVQTVNPHRLAVTDDVELARQRLRALVDCILLKTVVTNAGEWTDWAAVGEYAAELGLPARGGEYAKHGQTVADVLATKSDGERAKSAAGQARRLFQDTWIEGWRNGCFTKLVKSKVTVDLVLDVPLVVKDNATYYRCEISMPLPEGGWGITEYEWDRVLQLRYPTKQGRSNPGGANPDGMILPLGDLPSWSEEARGVQARLGAFGDSYRLLERPLTTPHAQGLERSWANNPRQVVARVRPGDLHMSVGGAVLEALQDVEITPSAVEVGLPQRYESVQTSAEKIADDVAAVEALLQDLDDRISGIEDDFAAARGRAKRTGAPEDSAKVERLTVRLTKAESEKIEHGHTLADLLAKLELRKMGLTGEPAVVAASASEVSSATAELLGVALTKCVRLAPPWLHVAAAIYLHDFKAVKVDRGAATDTLDWTCALVIHDSETALEARIPLAGSVLVRGYGKDGGRAQPEDQAWDFLYNGLSLAEIAAKSGLDESGAKNSYVYSNLNRSMAVVVPDAAYRAGIMHCPIVATRRVVWGLVTTDERAVEGINRGFQRHVAGVYTAEALRSRQTWCQTNHDLPRAVAAYLVERGGSAPMIDIMEEFGVSKTDVLGLAKTVKARRGEAAQGRVAFFTKNFDRGCGGTSVEERLLSLRACPHGDCPQLLRTQKPAWCATILWTPETEMGHGVLCPACSRLPIAELAGVRFPPDYHRPWNGRFGPGSKQTARKERSDTYIQSGVQDRGPGARLPDTGCLPRRDDSAAPLRDRQDEPDTRTRRMPLRGKRFYAHNLSASMSGRLDQYLATYGGIRAVRLVPTLGGFVTNGPDDERVKRARALGVPVYTLPEFLKSVADETGRTT